MQMDGWEEVPTDMTKPTAGIRKFAKCLKNVTRRHCIERVCKKLYDCVFICVEVAKSFQAIQGAQVL
jgi:hypothetical protein